MPPDTPVNYYSVLGVERDASLKDMNLAFKKLALKFHPDKVGPNEESTEKFRNVSEAIEVLRDPDRRREHNELLDRSVKGNSRFEHLYDLFGARRGRPRPTPADDAYWTGRSNEKARNQTPRPYGKAPEKSPEKPYEKKHDPWEAYLNGYRQNGMRYAPETSYAYHASDKWRPSYSKRNFDHLRPKDSNSEPTKFEAPSFGTSTFNKPKSEKPRFEPPRADTPSPKAETPWQPTYKDRCEHEFAETNPELQKGHTDECMMGGDVQELDGERETENEEDVLKDDPSNGFEGFDNCDQVSDIDEYITCQSDDSVCSCGSDSKWCRTNPGYSPSYNANFVDGGISLPDEGCRTPTLSSPRSDANSRSSDGETVFFSCTESTQSEQAGGQDSPTDEDSEGGAQLPDKRPDSHGAFRPFVPFFQAKLNDSAGRYTPSDFHREAEGLVLETHANWLETQRLSCPKASNDTEKCSHLGLWKKDLGRAKCDICHLWKPLYVLKCSGCGAKACVGCKSQIAA